MVERLGDQPIEQQYRKRMQKLAEDLDKVFNGDVRGHERKTGFVLMVYPFTNDDGTGTDGRCNYITNGANRKDVVLLMKEMIMRFEGQPETAGHG